MTIKPIIWINEGTKKNKTKFYLYDIFTTRKEAIMIAQYHKRQDKSKYIIIEYEKGFWFPYKMHALYFNNIKTKFGLTT